ncbi:MAG: NADH-quinone oxidoreductase subunit J [Bacteroidetes bacterium]|nr:NADH-quinone oxidoreductase subunit J [Bacteroidota bacterium]
MMNMSAIAFYCISAFILMTGLLAVTNSNLFRSAISLLFSLIGIAALYFWMEVEFAAAVQIIVYVGGIVVLIIFSIFLTRGRQSHALSPLLKIGIWCIGRTGRCSIHVLLIAENSWKAGDGSTFDPSVRKIGFLLVDNSPESYVLPFEVVSILLLAAMIGCIVIAIKSRPEEK